MNNFVLESNVSISLVRLRVLINRFCAIMMLFIFRMLFAYAAIYVKIRLALAICNCGAGLGDKNIGLLVRQNLHECASVVHGRGFV